MDTIKTDLDAFSDNVYCFTPTGEVKSLPNGATPVDFAYAIHSAVGNKMVGVRVNGKIVTFEYEIQNGDRIEVVTSQNSRGPSMDWLKFVKSSQARSKINQWFKKVNKEENIVKGKELLEKEAKKKGFNLSELINPERMHAVMERYAFRDWDSVCAAIGHGGLKEGQILNRLNEEYQKSVKKKQKLEDILNQNEQNASQQQASQDNTKKKKNKSGIIVHGIGDVAVRFSRCCNPVPGDEIVGFVTRGRGISIHRTDCVNIINLSEDERNRLMEAEWHMDAAKEQKKSFAAEVRITGQDRMGIMLDVTKMVVEEGIVISAINARVVKHEAVIDLTINITDKQQLEGLFTKIYNMPEIKNIERVTT